MKNEDITIKELVERTNLPGTKPSCSGKIIVAKDAFTELPDSDPVIKRRPTVHLVCS